MLQDWLVGQGGWLPVCHWGFYSTYWNVFMSNPGGFFCLCSPCCLHQPESIFFFYKISVLRCQSQWTFSTDVSAFSFLPPSEMIVTIYRIRVIGAEGSNCCYISASEQFVFVPSKIFLEMFLSPQSNTASVPCHAMTYICTEDAW